MSKDTSPINFDAYSQYYDLLYKDKDYSSEAIYINSLLNEVGMSAASILELGCGTGAHARKMVEYGHVIHGIDSSDRMISKASLVKGFTCEHGDARYIQLNRIFEVVIALFHVASYQVSEGDIHAFFSRAAEHVKDGGFFIFDFWYTPAVISQRPSIKVKRMDSENLTITRIAEPVSSVSESRVDVHYTIFCEQILGSDAEDVKTSIPSFHEIHPMRHFTLGEIDLLAKIHGFVRIRAEEFLSGAPLSEGTWGALVILKKII